MTHCNWLQALYHNDCYFRYERGIRYALFSFGGEAHSFTGYFVNITFRNCLMSAQDSLSALAL